MNHIEITLQNLCNHHFNLDFVKLKDILKNQHPHGEFLRWYEEIQSLKFEVTQQEIGDIPRICGTQSKLLPLLESLKPWRKGRFQLFDIDLDGEWRSELKFQRLLDAGVDFIGRDTLDVGCGNGYYMMRMENLGAHVLGIDPSWHYFAQFLLLKQLFSLKSQFLPLTLDDISLTGFFDLTLSMGVFYHRRDPFGHLAQLRNTLKNNGILILETLIIDGDENSLLLPEERYAGMKNVYFIPSSALLQRFVRKSGFVIEFVDEPVLTTTNEQRKTTWIDSYSLEMFVKNHQTIEGLPPPKRQILIARKK